MLKVPALLSSTIESGLGLIFAIPLVIFFRTHSSWTTDSPWWIIINDEGLWQHCHFGFFLSAIICSIPQPLVLFSLSLQRCSFWLDIFYSMKVLVFWHGFLSFQFGQVLEFMFGFNGKNRRGIWAWKISRKKSNNSEFSLVEALNTLLCSFFFYSCFFQSLIPSIKFKGVVNFFNLIAEKWIQGNAWFISK